MEQILEAKANPDLTFDKLEHIIRRRNYGVLATVSRDGRPHSTGILYAVSARRRPFSLYIVTDRRSKKARNIVQNPNVSFVVPISRRLGSLPPSSVQFQGTAEILPLTDEDAVEAFRPSVVLRRVLRTQLDQKREVSIFIRVRPDPVVFTYGVGMSILRLMKHVEGAATRVEIPPRRIESSDPSLPKPL